MCLDPEPDQPQWANAENDATALYSTIVRRQIVTISEVTRLIFCWSILTHEEIFWITTQIAKSSLMVLARNKTKGRHITLLKVKANSSEEDITKGPQPRAQGTTMESQTIGMAKLPTQTRSLNIALRSSNGLMA